MNLDTAISTAVDAHYNQKDKGGEPYILHPLRVMLEMDTHEEMMVAIMHDVLEDNKHYTIEGLRARGFSERILQAVMALTRMKEESYQEFIARACRDPLARKVKAADIEDNLRPGCPDSLRERYEKAKLYIMAYEVE